VWELAVGAKSKARIDKTSNWADNNAALQYRGSDTNWFGSEMNWCRTLQQEGHVAEIHSRCDPDVIDFASSIPSEASADDQLIEKPLSALRSRVGCTGFYLHLLAPAHAHDQYFISWFERTRCLMSTLRAASTRDTGFATVPEKIESEK